MNRREFLRTLGLVAGVAVAPRYDAGRFVGMDIGEDFVPATALPEYEPLDSLSGWIQARGHRYAAGNFDIYWDVSPAQPIYAPSASEVGRYNPVGYVPQVNQPTEFSFCCAHSFDLDEWRDPTWVCIGFDNLDISYEFKFILASVQPAWGPNEEGLYEYFGYIEDGIRRVAA